jgi:hypothetical protein
MSCSSAACVMLFFVFFYYSYLMMEAICPSETWVDFHRTTELYIIDDLFTQWIDQENGNHRGKKNIILIFKFNSKHGARLHWIIYWRVLCRIECWTFNIEWSVIWLNSLLFGFELLVQFRLIWVLAGVVCFLFAGHGEPVYHDLDSGVVK